jgi:hypothetical protein
MTYELSSLVGSSNFKLLYDPGNSFRAEFLEFPEAYKEMSIFEEFGEIESEIRHLHFKEYKKRGRYVRACAPRSERYRVINVEVLRRRSGIL